MVLCLSFVFFFFFKQKTAYEMRISDWSSDVCSSDLAKHVSSDIEVVQNMTGTTPSAWNDPTRGSELAQSQFDRGVDVIYAAAGGTGVGVYQTAADSGKFAIGVDSNQNYLHPGTMLTSMLKIGRAHV